MKTISTVLTILVTMGLSFAASASEENFNQTVRGIYASQNSLRTEEIILNSIPAKTFQQFLKLAEQQADIWVDTILEGDYSLGNEPVQLDAVAVIRDNKGQLVAYQITYSQKAWDTSNCEVNYEALDEKGADVDARSEEHTSELQSH